MPHRKRAQMRRLFKFQDGKCPYCLIRLPDPDDARDAGLMLDRSAPTLEHVKPRSLGGPDIMENLLLVHRICNEARGTRPLPPEALAAHARVLTHVAHWRAAAKSAQQ